MGLTFFVRPTIVANRIQHVVARGEQCTEAWNTQDWDQAPYRASLSTFDARGDPAAAELMPRR